jgi:uncharacterized protein YndB with AHSA1/START domain
MPEAVHESVDLAATPEEVWDRLMNPCFLEEWVSAHREIEELPDLPLREGSTFTQKLGVGPVKFKVDWEVLEADKPTLARWLGRGPGGAEAKITYRLEPDGNGGTRFRYENDYELPGGPVGRTAGKAVGSAAGKREARKSMKKLAEYFEAN